MKICILYDRLTPESSADQADALVQAEAVEAALISLGHSATRGEFHLGLDDVRRTLLEDEPDLVFNLVESVGGKGSLIHLAPALLDSIGIPYTGAPQLGIYATSNKIVAKRMMRLAGIPTPPWVDASGREDEDSGSPPGHLQWIVKSVWEHASVGLSDSSIVKTASTKELQGRLRSANRLGGDWFAEVLVDGREFNVSILEGPGGPEVITVAEILFVDFPPDKPRILGYASKWEIDSFEYRNTIRTFDLASTDEGLVSRMKAIALECWKLFELKGYARVDFRVDELGVPWVLEVNANPCLSPDAGFYAALEESNVGFVNGIGRILDAGLSGGRGIVEE